MPESSAPWDSTGPGDGSIAPYDAGSEWASYWRSLATAAGIATNLGGVFSGELNALEVTVVGAISPAVVASGRALAYGTWYENTAPVNVAIPTPVSATRSDYIVLRKDWAAQTVRITRIAGVEGGGTPALVQSVGVTWDTPLAIATITTGAALTVVDRRQWVPNDVLFRDPTDITVSNTITETNLLNYTVPGGTLKTTRRIRVTLEGYILNDSGSDRTIEFKVYWAGTVFLDDVTPNIPATSANLYAFKMVVELQADGSTANQVVSASLLITEATTTAGYGGFSANPVASGLLLQDVARNAAVDQALRVTAKLSAANANYGLFLLDSVAELL